MAMMGVDSGSLSRLAWSWDGGRLVPFYIHQMNRVNSRNGSAMINIVLELILLLLLTVLGALPAPMVLSQFTWRPRALRN